METKLNDGVPFNGTTGYCRIEYMKKGDPDASWEEVEDFKTLAMLYENTDKYMIRGNRRSCFGGGSMYLHITDQGEWKWDKRDNFIQHFFERKD